MLEKQQRAILESKEFVYALVAIGGLIALIEIIALLKGVDGTMFGTSMASLGAIGGYLLKAFLALLRKK